MSENESENEHVNAGEDSTEPPFPWWELRVVSVLLERELARWRGTELGDPLGTEARWVTTVSDAADRVALLGPALTGLDVPWQRFVEGYQPPSAPVMVAPTSTPPRDGYKLNIGERVACTTHTIPHEGTVTRVQSGDRYEVDWKGDADRYHPNGGNTRVSVIRVTDDGRWPVGTVVRCVVHHGAHRGAIDGEQRSASGGTHYEVDWWGAGARNMHTKGGHSAVSLQRVVEP